MLDWFIAPFTTLNNDKSLPCFTLYCLPSVVFADPCDTIESLSWLLGHWHAESDNLKTSESWQRVSARTWEGYGQTYAVKQDEVVSTETLRLVEMSDEVFYFAKVASNQYPVPFKLTHCGNIAIFENSTHDFPKKITYQRRDENHLSVLVSEDGGKGFTIEYHRQNDS